MAPSIKIIEERRIMEHMLGVGDCLLITYKNSLYGIDETLPKIEFQEEQRINNFIAIRFEELGGMQSGIGALVGWK